MCRIRAGVGLREGGGNCLKYLKRRWSRKEGRGNKDFKKWGGGQAGGSGTPLQTMLIWVGLSIWMLAGIACQYKKLIIYINMPPNEQYWLTNIYFEVFSYQFGCFFLIYFNKNLLILQEYAYLPVFKFLVAWTIFCFSKWYINAVWGMFTKVILFSDPRVLDKVIAVSVLNV